MPKSKGYWVDIAQNRLHRFDPASGLRNYHMFDAPFGCRAFAQTAGVASGAILSFRVKVPGVAERGFG